MADGIGLLGLPQQSGVNLTITPADVQSNITLEQAYVAFVQNPNPVTTEVFEMRAANASAEEISGVRGTPAEGICRAIAARVQKASQHRLDTVSALTTSMLPSYSTPPPPPPQAGMGFATPVFLSHAHDSTSEDVDEIVKCVTCADWAVRISLLKLRDHVLARRVEVSSPPELEEVITDYGMIEERYGETTDTITEFLWFRAVTTDFGAYGKEQISRYLAYVLRLYEEAKWAEEGTGLDKTFLQWLVSSFEKIEKGMAELEQDEREADLWERLRVKGATILAEMEEVEEAEWNKMKKWKVSTVMKRMEKKVETEARNMVKGEVQGVAKIKKANGKAAGGEGKRAESEL